MNSGLIITYSIRKIRDRCDVDAVHNVSVASHPDLNTLLTNGDEIWE